RSRASAGSAAAAAIAAAAPSRSAPAARMNGLPVTPTAAISPAAARAATASTAAFSDISPRAPNVEGRVWSFPLSKVIKASVPVPRSTSRTCAWVTISSGSSPSERAYSASGVPVALGPEVSGIDVLPQDGAAHAEAGAHGRDAVPDLWPIGQLGGELDHQPDARRGQRVPDGDRAA